MPEEILDPADAWDDRSAYDANAKRLANLFKENFERFEGGVDEEVSRATREFIRHRQMQG